MREVSGEAEGAANEQVALTSTGWTGGFREKGKRGERRRGNKRYYECEGEHRRDRTVENPLGGKSSRRSDVSSRKDFQHNKNSSTRHCLHAGRPLC